LTDLSLIDQGLKFKAKDPCNCTYNV